MYNSKIVVNLYQRFYISRLTCTPIFHMGVQHVCRCVKRAVGNQLFNPTFFLILFIFYDAVLKNYYQNETVFTYDFTIVIYCSLYPKFVKIHSLCLNIICYNCIYLTINQEYVYAQTRTIILVLFIFYLDVQKNILLILKGYFQQKHFQKVFVHTTSNAFISNSKDTSRLDAYNSVVSLFKFTIF